MERPTDEFENTHNMKLHLPSTQFGGLVSRKQISQLCTAAILQPDLASNRILEVTADPSYPKLTAIQLLEQLPKDVSSTEWRAKLTPDQFYILREAGTERPWTSPLNAEKRLGMFTCGGCGAELFPSTTKFESGTGWPSFYAPRDVTSVNERKDFMLGIVATTRQTLSSIITSTPPPLPFVTEPNRHGTHRGVVSHPNPTNPNPSPLSSHILYHSSL